MERRDIKFKSEGLNCSAWFYVPDEASSMAVPTIVMAHGFSLVKEAFLDLYAQKFCDEGFAVLVFDYRNLGESDAYKPLHLDPQEQIKDYRNAITWVRKQREVDPEKIGIWGTSYSGGHVLQVAAMDRRVKAAVAQVPTINGRKGAVRKMGTEKFQQFMKELIDYREQRYDYNEHRMIPVVSLNGNAAQPHPDAYKWFTATAKVAPNWENEITLESMELYFEYNPSSLIEFIAPTPLLMIAAMEDGITPPDLIIEAFEDHANEPKSLLQLPGGHFDVYNGPTFNTACEGAIEWFQTYLGKGITQATNQ